MSETAFTGCGQQIEAECKDDNYLESGVQGEDGGGDGTDDRKQAVNTPGKGDKIRAFLAKSLESQRKGQPIQKARAPIKMMQARRRRGVGQPAPKRKIRGSKTPGKLGK